MPHFSQRSLMMLSQCHPDLIRVAQEAIKHFDFVVICGHRGEAEQEKAFHDGVSKAHWLQSPHNYTPSLAFDACPYPIDWSNATAFALMQDAMVAAAKVVGVDITLGADFDHDGKRHEPGENDNPHFQLTNWKQLRGT